MPNIFQSFIHQTQRAARFMAGPYPIYYLMPWFMILLVGATIEQKNLGLYDAVHTYLYNFILWMGPLPLPGGGTTLVLITLSLALKFLFFSPWSWKRCGIILSHLGCLLLLLGGLVTIIDSQEGFIVIPEGQERAYYQDYHEREFIISKQEEEYLFNFEEIKEGKIISHKAWPFEIKIIDKCNNCAIAPNKKDNRNGLAREITLADKPSELNREENFAGLTFSLMDKKEQKTLGEFITLEDVKQDEFIEDYQFNIIRSKTDLPFSIQLQDFRKIDYPGTNKASNFQSDLVLREDGIEWPITIEMNKPYRYKGYSLFQSSFDQRNGKEVTVLTIVKNSGRLFPYISSFIIFLGLFLHLISRSVRRNQSLRKAQSNG